MNKIAKVNHPVVKNIVRVINEKGFKQNAIAENAGMTPQALCDVIGDRRILKINEIVRLAAALGVDISELFKTD